MVWVFSMNNAKFLVQVPRITRRQRQLQVTLESCLIMQNEVTSIISACDTVQLIDLILL